MEQKNTQLTELLSLESQIALCKLALNFFSFLKNKEIRSELKLLSRTGHIEPLCGNDFVNWLTTKGYIVDNGVERLHVFFTIKETEQLQPTV